MKWEIQSFGFENLKVHLTCLVLDQFGFKGDIALDNTDHTMRSKFFLDKHNEFWFSFGRLGSLDKANLSVRGGAESGGC